MESVRNELLLYHPIRIILHNLGIELDDSLAMRLPIEGAHRRVIVVLPQIMPGYRHDSSGRT